MRLAILGAAAPLGARVARDLSYFAGVESLVLADAALPEIDSLLEEDRSAEVTAVHLDGTDDSYARAVDGAGIVIDCIPGGSPLRGAAAALAAKRPYLSAAGSPDGVAAARAMGPQAEEAGTVIVAGLGWPAALAGLIASAASDRTGFERLRVAWAVPPQQEDWSGPSVMAGSGPAQEAFFPEPVGWQWLHVGVAPEGWNIPGGGRVEVGEAYIGDDSGAAALGPAGEFLRAGRRRLARLTPRRRTPEAWAAVRFDGERAGGTVTLGLVDQLPNLAPAPVVVAAQLLIEGAALRPGAATPHEIFDTHEFMGRLGARGVRVARLVR